MEVAALAVAIFAVLVPGVAAYFAYRQANAAWRQAEAATDQAAVAREQAVAAREQADAAREQAQSARQQADAAMELIRIEQERIRDELRPRFEAKLQYLSGAAHRLEIKLASPRPLVSVDVQIVSGKVQFVGTEGGANQDTSSYGRLEGGASTSWWIRVSYPYPEEMQLRISCKGEGPGEQWIVPLSVQVFPELQETRPKFEAAIEEQYPPPHMLHVRLESHGRVKLLEAVIVRGEGIRFAGSGNAQARHEISKARWDNLSQGQIASWPITADPTYSEKIGLELRCTGTSEERWNVGATVPVPFALGQPGEPEFAIEIEEMAAPHHRLVLELLSIWPVTSIAIAISHGWGVRFVDPKDVATSDRQQSSDRFGRQGYMHQEEKGLRTRSKRKLERGERATFLIAVERSSPSLSLEIMCTGLNNEQWTVRTHVNIPGWLRT